MAAALAFRLRRLEAMREAGTRLANRNRLGRDVFARGRPEPVAVNRRSTYTATLYDLLSAYAARRVYRWCSPPTTGCSMTSPISGGSTFLGSGESLSSDRWVRHRW